MPQTPSDNRLAFSRLFRATSYLRSALWVVPLIAIALELMTMPLLHRLDLWLGWRLIGLGTAGATALFQTLITLTLSFVVFTFGSMLVAIQIAGGQLTPRIIATALLRDNVVRYSVGLFVFTLFFAVGAFNRMEGSVQQLVAFIAGVLGVACMATFLLLIDYSARLLRPVSIVAKIGDSGLEVIRSLYPDLSAQRDAVHVAPRPAAGMPERIVPHAGRSEIVLAVDTPSLVRLARAHDGVIELVPQVGDFVAAEETLFALYGGATAIDEESLRSAVAFGRERTLEQDPIFAFRILVDIGLKALSPAINDPTTSILAIDQVHRLLRVVGQRRLRGEVIADDAGTPRVIFRTPNWEDFVHVACHEIRMCGAANAQVARRMRAMLENLVRALPEYRHAALRGELSLLDRTIEKLYPFPEDLALVRIADPQGLGGSSGSRRDRA